MNEWIVWYAMRWLRRNNVIFQFHFCEIICLRPQNKSHFHRLTLHLLQFLSSDHILEIWDEEQISYGEYGSNWNCNSCNFAIFSAMCDTVPYPDATALSFTSKESFFLRYCFSSAPITWCYSGCWCFFPFQRTSWILYHVLSKILITLPCQLTVSSLLALESLHHFTTLRCRLFDRIKWRNHDLSSSSHTSWPRKPSFAI